ncbi:MAG: EamA family transporter [Burkholderiaceae bacterium]
MTHSQRAISGVAFLTLLTIALMMGANHVAARFAFDSGVDVVTAIAFRSVLTAFVIALIVWQQRVPLMLTRQQQRHLPVIGLLIAVQSFCLYSAVARLPVVLALLAFNTYPISTALWARLLYKQRPQREVLLVIPCWVRHLA